ncbi:MAG: hypothetical protein NTW67_01310 [Candidatus Woesearchaeota archaeon]|nr:hypothetical protein [Candidatus Woesearchaeota archaeon]
MKKILLILMAVLICASVADAYVYRTIGSSQKGIMSKITGGATSLASEDAGLGRVEFNIHAYTIGTPETASVRPGTPLFGKLVIDKATTGSPPITEEETTGHDGVTILVTEVGPKGDIQLYGTNNVKGNILPSNRFMYDPTPGVEAWTNNAFVANSDVNTVINYVVLVKYKDETRLLQTKTLRVK